MSLLEDVFLEDEAGEAQELERVIEGDDYDERPLSPNSTDNEEKDEAEEDKRRVDPTQGKAKRVVKNPRFILNPARLTGPRGIQVIPDHFKDFKFKGKGHEKEDLDMVLKKLEHWAYRLYPKFGFHDCLKKIEMLGKKKTVMVHLQKIRSDLLISEEAVVQKDSSDDEPEAPAQEDEFDKLLQQQIQLARATPAPGSVKPGFTTPSVADRSLMMPKATSSPSISDEQRERMLRNRRLAEERKLAKFKNDNSVAETLKKNNLEVIIEPEATTEVIDEAVARKHNRSHVIDSSDEDESIVNKHISVDKMDDVEFNENETFKQRLTVINEVDITEQVIDEVIARKHNRSRIIDSSDDDEPIINRSIADVHGIVDDQIDDVEFIDKNENPKQNLTEVISESDATNEVINKVAAWKHNKSNVIDSFDEDGPVVQKSIAIDVESTVKNKDNVTSKQYSPKARTETVKEEVARKPNKSNVIDSSDEDEPVVNQSITVNVHEDIEISNTNQNKKMTINKSFNTTNTQESHLITDNKIDNSNDDVIRDEESDKSNIVNTHTSKNNDSDLRVDESKYANSETNELRNDIKLPNANENFKLSDEPKSLIENVDSIDEVMDIDFTDDF